jgi:hypothetical protein
LRKKTESRWNRDFPRFFLDFTLKIAHNPPHEPHISLGRFHMALHQPR